MMPRMRQHNQRQSCIADGISEEAPACVRPFVIVHSCFKISNPPLSMKVLNASWLCRIKCDANQSEGATSVAESLDGVEEESLDEQRRCDEADLGE